MAELTKTDGELLAEMGTDATRWAAQFARVVHARAHEMARWDREEAAEHGVHHRLTHLEARDMLATDPTPGGLLHGWFCSAIEAGRAAGRAEVRPDPTLAPRITFDRAEPRTVQHWQLYLGEHFVADTSEPWHVQVWADALGLALPANLAGSDALPADVAATPPADVAGSDLPADPAGSYAERVLERLTIALERQAIALDAFRACYAAANPVASRFPAQPMPGPSRVDPPRAPWQDDADAPEGWPGASEARRRRLEQGLPG